MELVVIALTACGAAVLTFFSGFGLGTVLTPAFALFFPVALAVAMTATVHLANNLFKLALVGRHADPATVWRFGVPAALAALVGASLLASMASLPAWWSYTLWGSAHKVTPVKACVGLVIVVFALLELSPAFARLTVAPRWLALGGLLSGFFGGLSGNQGALRSVFLVKLGLGKEAYLGTGAVCAMLVDASRLAVYGSTFPALLGDSVHPDMHLAVLMAVLCAFTGSYLGKKLLKKVSLRLIERLVATLLVLVGTGLMTGLV